MEAFVFLIRSSLHRKLGFCDIPSFFNRENPSFFSRKPQSLLLQSRLTHKGGVVFMSLSGRF